METLYAYSFYNAKMFEAVPDSAPGYDRFAFDVAIHVLVAKVLVTKWHLAEAAAFSPEDEISSEVHWSQSSIFRVLFSSKMTIYLFNMISTISIP